MLAIFVHTDFDPPLSDEEIDRYAIGLSERGMLELDDYGDANDLSVDYILMVDGGDAINKQHDWTRS